MNNKLKWFLNIFLTTISSSLIFYFIVLFSQRLTIGTAILYRDLFWITTFYPEELGWIGFFITNSYNYILPVSILIMVLSVGLFIECFRKTNSLKFISGLFALFFISVTLFLSLLVITNNGHILNLSKYLIVIPLYLFVFKFKDSLLNKE